MDFRCSGGPPRPTSRLGEMGNWRVYLLATLGLLFTLGGLLVLALPGPYEGAPLYALDPSHSIGLMDLVGLGLVIIGTGMAWWSGIMWQRWMDKGRGAGEE